MSQHFLGKTFDIHGGGEDLIFPHHENEIAQSEGASGEPLANYWLYNGFVKVSSEKMSKSLGNFFTVKDILINYHPEVVRLFMLQSHYKSPVDFSDESLAEARIGMNRFYATLRAVQQMLRICGDFSAITVEKLPEKERALCDRLISLREKFTDAMDDDFSTPRAIGYIFDAIRLVNGYMTDEKFSASPQTCFFLDRANRIIIELGGVLGLFRDNPDEYFILDRDREARKRGLDINEINRLIEERRSARQAKDWKKADEIRSILMVKKVILQDTPAATSWKIE
jgi:cysteinyl-tRNA synthetase